MSRNWLAGSMTDASTDFFTISQKTILIRLIYLPQLLCWVDFWCAISSENNKDNGQNVLNEIIQSNSIDAVEKNPNEINSKAICGRPNCENESRSNSHFRHSSFERISFVSLWRWLIAVTHVSSTIFPFYISFLRNFFRICFCSGSILLQFYNNFFLRSFSLLAVSFIASLITFTVVCLISMHLRVVCRNGPVNFLLFCLLFSHSRDDENISVIYI